MRITTSESSKTVEADNNEEHQFGAAIDNFLRLGLLVLALEPPPKPAMFYQLDMKPKKEKVFFTALGYDFMQACLPPQL